MEELFRLDLARCLGKVLGIPLKEIREYIDDGNTTRTLKDWLAEQEKEVEEALLTMRGYVSETDNSYERNLYRLLLQDRRNPAALPRTLLLCWAA